MEFRFSSTASPVLERLDHWAVTWQNTVNNKLARIIDQNSYDHQAASKDNKQLERLVLGAFDRCSAISERERKDKFEEEEREEESEVVTERTEKSVVMSDESRSEEERVEPGCEDPNLVESGVSKVFRVGSARINSGGRDYNVRYCDQERNGGGWTVIQRRGAFGEERENFTRNWKDYKDGFGDLNGEFWFGLEFVNSLTQDRKMMLRVELESHYGQTAWAEYEEFRIDGEDEDYRLWVGGYSGNASDSLSAHNGYKFSTVDRNNDLAPKCCPCAPAYGGGWWFYR